MDPVSQGVLGACAAQSVASRSELRIAAVVGMFGGMAPDLDVLIRSASDPLLFLEYHRQFTHSLIFIPLGSVLTAIACYFVFARKKLSFSRTWFLTACGYATHALLDACTTYGTQLFWPFSDTRVAWNTVSVIDPAFTLPVLVLVVLALTRNLRPAAWMALTWAVIYPTIGLVQRERAETAGLELARSRGHQPVSLSAKPSFGNLVLWKIVYQADDQYYVDAVHSSTSIKVYEGESIPLLQLERDLPWLDMKTQQARDVERFRWFSNGYLARHYDDPNQVIDIRYSLLPNQIKPLWTIRLDPNAKPDSHVDYLVSRQRDAETMSLFKQMLLGK